MLHGKFVSSSKLRVVKPRLTTHAWIFRRVSVAMTTRWWAYVRESVTASTAFFLTWPTKLNLDFSKLSLSAGRPSFVLTPVVPFPVTLSLLLKAARFVVLVTDVVKAVVSKSLLWRRGAHRGNTRNMESTIETEEKVAVRVCSSICCWPTPVSFLLCCDVYVDVLSFS